jgi:hypothetical protein
MPKAAMTILADNGLLRAGMELEPVPSIIPNPAPRPLTEFRAVILKPNGGPDSIRWKGEIQSLSQMLAVLEKDHGACGLYGVHRNFRIVGHESSLRDEAEGFSHGEEIVDQENCLETPSEKVAESPGDSTATNSSTSTGILTRSWLRENIEKIVIPVIVAVLTAALLALLGLSK